MQTAFPKQRRNSRKILAWNSQTHEYRFPSNGITLKLPLITKYGYIKRLGSRNDIPGTDSIARRPQTPGFGVFLRSFMIRGCFFSPYCQHCWAETMAHITETQRNVLDAGQTDVRRRLAAVGNVYVVIGQWRLSVTEEGNEAPKPSVRWRRRDKERDRGRKQSAVSECVCVCVYTEFSPHSVLEWG